MFETPNAPDARRRTISLASARLAMSAHGEFHDLALLTLGQAHHPYRPMRKVRICHGRNATEV